MQVKDLQPRQGNVEITIEVSEKGDIREFDKFGKKGRVCSAKAKDDTGEVILSLWNEQIDQVNTGDKVKITNGYVSEFQGEKQLTTGKFGKMEVIGKAEATGEASGEPETVYTNAPPEQFKDETKIMQGQIPEDLDLSDEAELSEEPVEDEEYIG
ncbi:MAG: hypothetical protein ABIJ08_07430 [Nanoarchaeota archaeon]